MGGGLAGVIFLYHMHHFKEVFDTTKRIAKLRHKFCLNVPLSHLKQFKLVKAPWSIFVHCGKEQGGIKSSDIGPSSDFASDVIN